MKIRKDVSGTQDIEPSTIEINGTSVYIRSNIRRESRDMGDGQKAEFWVYDEDQLESTEYDQLLALNLTIDRWDAGLQEACREARYRRWDGAEQSVRRKIELGIDVEQNQARLKKILDYKQAVHDTMNQPGYPTNEPIWPPEPIL